MSALEIVPIRRALGLTEQPLRKNEKVGVGRAKIVLNQEIAAKLFALRSPNHELPHIVQKVGRRTV